MLRFHKKINTIRNNVFCLFLGLLYPIFASTTAALKGLELQPYIVYNHLQASGNLLICLLHMVDDRGASCLAHKLRPTAPSKKIHKTWSAPTSFSHIRPKKLHNLEKIQKAFFEFEAHSSKKSIYNFCFRVCVKCKVLSICFVLSTLAKHWEHFTCLTNTL